MFIISPLVRKFIQVTTIYIQVLSDVTFTINQTG